MMHEIGRELDAWLRDRGCPIRVVDGPEPSTTTTYARERIVLEYGKSFKFAGPEVPHGNPAHPWKLSIPGKVTIYVQSPKAGAMLFEHRRRALAVVRLVASGLRQILVARKNWPTIEAGDFEEPPDLEKSEVPNGAAFSFAFRFDTGVPNLTWTGTGEPEGTISAVESVTRARRPNEAPEEGETACGG